MEPDTNLYSLNEKSEIIRENSQKILSVLSAHQIALWEYDIPTGKCSFTDDYFRMLGLKEAGVIFKDIDDFYQFVHPDDIAAYQEAFAEMLASESKTSQMRVRCIGEHGEIIWLEDHFLSHREDNDEGHPDKLLAYTVNVTLQCEKEQQIKHLEIYNRKIIEALPEFIFIFDDNFFITDVLMAPDTILLHPVEVLRGVDARNIYSKEVSDLFICNIKECLADGKLKEIEYPLEVEGRRYYFQARIAPFESNKVLALIHDIGDRIRRSQELIEAKRRAEDADRMKSVFLANMSHEIRTPLNAIVGFSKLLPLAESPEEEETYSDIINQNSDILLQLINDILDLSKIEAGTLEYIKRPMNLGELCRTIYEVHKGRVQEGVTLFLDNQEADLLIEEDHNRIMQVITNFITNASKFTYSGEIRYGFELREDHIYFYVKDTGIGVAQDKINQIFDRFVKLNSFAQGTGLGLAICRMIIEKIGGEIGAISDIGKGSTFYFTIPYKDKDRERIKVFEVAEEKKEDSFVKRPQQIKKILIAEDVESNFILVKNLIGKDYTLLWAKDGMEAVEMYKEYQPDLILMDIKMPRMNGLDATHIIRSYSKDIPIIALTAYAFETDKEKALDVGCNDFVTKPISEESLVRVLRKYSGFSH